MGGSSFGLLEVHVVLMFNNNLSDGENSRLILNVETDILAHFSALATAKKLPTLDDLVAKADTIRQRYASQTAYDQSLSKSEYDKADPVSQVPSGTLG
jgi:hypothetical protein